MDLSKFKSTYPEGWKAPIEPTVNKDDIYSLINNHKNDSLPKINKGIVCISKSVIPPEIGKPNRMATYGEMTRVWDHINKELYDRLIEIKYHNA